MPEITLPKASQQILSTHHEFSPPPEAKAHPLSILIQSVILLGSWSLAFPFIQLALKDGMHPGELASLRYTLAAVFLIPFLFLKSKKLPFAGTLPQKKDWWRFAVCGLLGFALYNLLLNIGETSMTPSASCLINCTAPIFAAFLGIIFCKDHLTLWGWIGASVALGGVAIVAMSNGAVSASNLQGPLVLLLSCFLTAIFTLLQHPLIQRYGPMCSLAWIVLFGTLCLSIWLPSGIVELYHVPPKTFLNVLGLAIFPSVLGYACWSSLVGKLGAANACILLYGEPPLTIISSIFLTGDQLTLGIVIGGTIVLTGMFVARLRPVRNAPILRRKRTKKKKHFRPFHNHKNCHSPDCKRAHPPKRKQPSRPPSGTP
ncbi:DMT family transporter [Acetobacteraceae bacterium]|nr:DMT family transporter [Acetobacteraceae bacterium]